MGSFDHLKKMKVSAGVTREFPLPEIADKTMLTVRPAGEANPAYFNDTMRKSSRSDLKKAGTNKIDTAFLARSRNLDRTLYAEHVVVGWSDVVDGDGVTVPFSKAACRELLEALPDDVLDQLRVFCQDASNFREADDADRTGN